MAGPPYPPDTSSVDTDDEELRSYFDNVTKECKAFRILLIGKSGSGKSTLVSEVFDFELDAGAVKEFSIGQHNINEEILSANNKSLILHDSKGLESGSDANLKIITKFIQERRGRPFAEQLHAIWYCVEIPVSGERLFEGGDIALFQSLKDSNNEVPLIVVFTKLDKLQFHEKRRLKKSFITSGMEAKAAAARAQTECLAAAERKYTKSCIDVLQSKQVLQSWAKYCAVSHKQPESIVKLIELTKSMLTESESLNILFAQAQMVDVDLKVSLSLRAGKNLYRLGMSASMIPLKAVRKVSVLKVLSRIHSDIVQIWNINDPEEILSGANMRTMVRKLFIEPIMSPNLDGHGGSEDESSQIISNLAGSILNPTEMIGPAITGAVKVLDDIMDTTPAAARVLMAYILDLTLGMENLHWVLRPRKDKSVKDADIIHAFTRYRASEQRRLVHRRIRDFIGDENIIRSFNREKVLSKLSDIVAKCRFNPAEAIKGRTSSPQPSEN